ncbi:hypothetical protein Pmar_PMAR027827, partial [Perkinsus marinus ATCC 50983]
MSSDCHPWYSDGTPRAGRATLPNGLRLTVKASVADMLWSKHEDFTTYVAFRDDGKLIATGDGSEQ